MMENPLENIENRSYTVDINKVNNMPSAICTIHNHVPKAFIRLFFRPLRQKGMLRRLFLVQAWDMALRAELVCRLRRHRHLRGARVRDFLQRMACCRRRLLCPFMGHAWAWHASHGRGGQAPSHRRIQNTTKSIQKT